MTGIKLCCTIKFDQTWRNDQSKKEAGETGKQINAALNKNDY